ncbi:MAG: hypothetical protein KDE24_06840 [Caldilinea sp.]|nr:hypothetical protein [Caldilinea sp.]MCB0049242.1 hypothetical protein [Caldilinea sp.]
MTLHDDSSSTPRTSTDGWAKPVSKLSMGVAPTGAINLNVNGKHITGPLKGFGQLWQKTYSVRLAGSEIAPTDLIKVWKAEFPNFWPDGNRFYGAAGQIEPGDVALLNLSGPGGATISTGILVIYADAESFSFMTPQGHIFAGMITFSSHEDDGATVAQIQALVRASDPIYEMGCRVGIAHKSEDAFWHGTLRSLAARFGVNGIVQQRNSLIDPRMQWSAAGDVWHNAAVRTTLYAPVNAVQRLFTPG